MRRLLYAATAALGAIAIAAAQAPPPQRFTGCLQRSPSKAQVFVLTNASNSPLGGNADDASVPPPPSRGTEPIERRPGQSDARQETGGVTYLLQGGTNLEAIVGQRVEVTGTLGAEALVPPTRPTTERPMRQLRVTRVKPIAPNCD